MKVSIRATLIGFPWLTIDIPADCFGTYLVAHPRHHHWWIWFDDIRIGAWDGETSDVIATKFKNEFTHRRFVITYNWENRIRIKEK